VSESSAFDPYYKWLGIPPSEQPPNFYRLLGVVLFESDPDVIEAAADQRMAHIRTYQTGKHGVVSQKILNELADARLTLLNPVKKAGYDARLRRQSLGPEAMAPAAAIPIATPLFESPAIAPSMSRSMPRRKRPSFVPVIAIGLVVLGVAFVIFRSRDSSNRKVGARTSPREAQIPLRPPTKTTRAKVPAPTPDPAPVGSLGPAVVASSERPADKTPLRIVDHKTETYQQDGSDVARGDDGSFFISTIGEVGAAAVGYELEGAQRLTVDVKVGGALRPYDDNSFAGFIVDYHTPAGYSRRVALTLGLHNDRRTSGGPAWGKETIPERFVDLSVSTAKELNLEQWAPTEWDGRVWFSVMLQNSGPMTSIEGRILLPAAEDDNAQ
jgi:hypothetical protein